MLEMGVKLGQLSWFIGNDLHQSRSLLTHPGPNDREHSSKLVCRYVCRHVEESAKPNGECKTKQSSGNLTTVLTALHLARAPKFQDFCKGETFPFHHVLEDKNLIRIECMT